MSILSHFGANFLIIPILSFILEPPKIRINGFGAEKRDFNTEISFSTKKPIPVGRKEAIPIEQETGRCCFLFFHLNLENVYFQVIKLLFL